MTDLRLTIAIPTYNRSEYLIECLDSVLGQIEEGVEILISDNASSDDTEAVCQQYQVKYPFISYSKNSENIGPDANFLRCLQEGRGDFIHLLSDDDILLPGAVTTILTAIKLHPEVAVIRTNCCSFNQHFSVNSLSLPAYSITDDILMSDKNHLLAYVGYASVFMSTTIYNKSCFNQLLQPDRFIGSYLLQTHVLFACLAINARSMIVAKTCVAARVGMPVSFNLCRILVVQWKKVLYGTCKDVGYDAKTIRHIYNSTIVRNLPGMVRDTHLSESSYGSVFRLIFKETWQFPSAWICLYPYALLPKSILRLLSIAKQRLLK